MASLVKIALPIALLSAAVAWSVARGGLADTARMAERLRDITENANPQQNLFMNARRVALLEAEASQSADGEVDPALLRALAQELLNAGRTAEAIARLDALEAMIRRGDVEIQRRQWIDLRITQAVAQLRLGEEQNCQENHNAKSCLFPIRGAGVHPIPAGSRAAVAILQPLLERNPDNLGVRWLLNIAYMTLGKYPDGVSEPWLLEPELFASDADIGAFPDVAHALGVDVEDLAGGSIAEDFDGDGRVDIMASSMGLQSPLRYFRNDANGAFIEMSEAAGLTGLTGGLNLMQSDFDNDGDSDVLVLRGGWMGAEGHYPNSLLRNNGDGTFSDVSEEAGMLSFHPTQTASWFDFDADGHLDLFIGNESTAQDAHPCELYRNNGDGTFTEMAERAGLALVAFVKGVVSGDYNNDGRPDLYVSIHGERNRLYRNDGPKGSARSDRAWRFTEVAAEAGVTEPIESFPTWFFDYDNDGWEDLFVSGYRIVPVGEIAADYLGQPSRAETPRLYRNNGNGTFADVTDAARLRHALLSMGANYGDLDNDGWLDFYVGTGNPSFAMLVPNRMFRNAAGRTFEDVTTSAGVGHLQKGHGVSFADFDSDGDQDIYHVVGGAFEGDGFRNALFENPGHGNHWIALALEGVSANRPAIGARIHVVIDTPSGERSIHRTGRSGGSFGASPLRQEIGLGDATRIRSVVVRWPAPGGIQSLAPLELDRAYRVREGDATPQPLDLAPFRFASARASTD
ncbi:MAG TPA: CRTAC1 family protein [Myxococcota bacterium]|nr:CRTAC1 family protein [Myxococcota bacterium]